MKGKQLTTWMKRRIDFPARGQLLHKSGVRFVGRTVLHDPTVRMNISWGHQRGWSAAREEREKFRKI